MTDEVAAALRRAEQAVERGEGLSGTGFWKAVGRARAAPEDAREYAEQIARIDRAAFERAVRLRLPILPGMVILLGGLIGGLVAISLAAVFTGLVRDVVFLGGVVAVNVFSHTPAHVAVGSWFGIRFTHVFVGGPPPPRPGAKIDYATYLLVPPRQRAFMHASGAVVTKVVPFVLLPAGLRTGVSGWVIAAVLTLGVAQIVTDIVLSTKLSDWKKAIREWRAASS